MIKVLDVDVKLTERDTYISTMEYDGTAEDVLEATAIVMAKVVKKVSLQTCNLFTYDELLELLTNAAKERIKETK